MVGRVCWTLVGAAMCAALNLTAQVRSDSTAADTVALAPGPHHRANWLHRWLLGSNYRDLWTQPITVERLDLARLGGGLIPECLSGRPETALLDLRGADQHSYVFQPAGRGPSTSPLTVRLRRTPAADMLRDQAASRLPAGGLVVPPLLEAAGVLHTEPKLGILPEAAALGPFGQVFAGMLGTVEQRPEAGFAGSDRVEDTEHVWAKIGASPGDRVDGRAYLTARLIDLLVGDADRAPDRWSWARYGSDRGHVWRPIPSGRDQAFARLDGVVLSVARRYLPQLVSFGPSYPDMYGLTWSARALDRRLLVALSKAEWDSIARTVQARLTDRVLEAAVAQLPRDMLGRTGAALLPALKSRRDRLLEAVDGFYALVTEYADIRATDQDEWAEIERLGPDQVRVQIALAGGREAPYFDRTFATAETKEIRLYLAGGNDRVMVRGSAARSARVRVVGGSGQDVLMDSSLVGLPVVRRVLTTTFFYDADGDSEFVSGPGTEIDRRPFRSVPSPGAARPDTHAPTAPGGCGGLGREGGPADLGHPFQDWGSRWVPTPWVSFQSDLGLLVGAGAERHGYGFREVPYGSRQTLRGAFATGPQRLRVWYEGDFRNLPRGAWATLSFRYSGIDVLRFYGFGNETQITAPPEFYRVTQRRVAAAASLTVFPPRSRISVGPFFAFTETETGQGGLIDSLRPHGVEGFVEAGADARVEIDTRDRSSVPRRGVHLVATGRFVPRGLDVEQSYGSVSGEAATYVSIGDPARIALAMRAGGKRVWGRYPFHAAAFLGGANTVRGFNEQRFAGDAVLYGNGEVRLFLARISVPLPAEVGVLGLGDVGRAFVAGERSTRWHGAVGGGLWLAFIERGSTVTLTAARSPERWAYYAGLGFMF